MLEDIVNAVSNLSSKKRQVRLINDGVFVRDTALGNVAAKLREIYSIRGAVLEKNASLSLVRKHFSSVHYYLIENGEVWSGYLMDADKKLCNLPQSIGTLYSGYDNLICEDPSIPKDAGVKLLGSGKYVAEFEYDGRKRLVRRSAFDRFVRMYRQNREISLRECLFEMYRYIRRAGVRNDDLVNKLKIKLSKLCTKQRTKDKRETKKPLLGFGKTWYLYFKGEPGWIFVRHNDEIIYCQPIF